MKATIICPRCDEKYNLDPERIPEKGGRITCRTCGFIISIKKHLIQEDLKKGTSESDSTLMTVQCPKCGFSFKITPLRPSAKEKEEDKRTILLVEDQEFFINFTREILEKRYRVCCATTVNEALEILGKEKVDIVLLDLILKDEDGRDLLKQAPKKCPVIIYTSKDEMEMYGKTWNDLKKLGADDVVYKAMNVEDSIFLKIESFFSEKLK
ncbi:MAG: response regulator [Acidobacteriota bacterium]